MGRQLPPNLTIHDDLPTRAAARAMGVLAFTPGHRIVLGDGTGCEAVLRHELVHAAQIAMAVHGARSASDEEVEAEAHVMADLPVARPVTRSADPARVHPLVWLIPVGAGLFVAAYPRAANAPGPTDEAVASSDARIFGEAFALFAVPGGAFLLGGRLGLGFLGSAAAAGAAGNASLRAVGDASRGSLSPPLMYLFDAATGAVVGFVVPGGVRWLGRRGTEALDSLTTQGMVRADIAVTRALHDAALVRPLNAEPAAPILRSRGLMGQVSRTWLRRRNMIVLYRGQTRQTREFLSPLAREQGVVASDALVARMRVQGMTDVEIATMSARHHVLPAQPFNAPASLVGQPLGATGIPTTTLPGIAAGFGDEGVIYVIRMPRNAVVKPTPWQWLELEDEWTVFTRVPPGSVIRVIPGRDVAPPRVNDAAQLVPAR